MSTGQPLMRRAVRLLPWIARHELGFLVALLLAAGAAWAFVELADEVLEGETQAIDERLLLALREPLFDRVVGRQLPRDRHLELFLA